MPELPWDSGSLELPLLRGRAINPSLAWLEPTLPAPLSKIELQTQVDKEFQLIAPQIKKAARIALLLEDPSRPSRTRELAASIIRKIGETRGGLTGVSVIVAAGAHYRIEPEALAMKLPALDPPAVIHDATSTSNLAHLGFSQSGVDFWFNRNIAEAELRLSISTVNLHPLVGFSGGGKILLPGVAGIETIRGLHRLPAGTAGAAQTAMRDLINEVLDRLPIAYSWHLLSRPDGGIFRIFAGPVQSSHSEARNELLRLVTLEPPSVQPQLLILGAHPFHQNLIGSFKSLHQIPAVLAPGGCALLINEATQGVGFHHWRNDPAVTAAEKEKCHRMYQAYRVALYSPGTQPEAFRNLFPEEFVLLRSFQELTDFLKEFADQPAAVIPYAPVTLIRQQGTGNRHEARGVRREGLGDRQEGIGQAGVLRDICVESLFTLSH